MTRIFRARATAAALLAIALAAPVGRAQGQGAVLTGKVTTEFGQPLGGANVYITEMGISVGTNADGAYTISIAGARVQAQSVNLRVRAFGYLPQARPLRLTTGTQTIDFALRQDVNRLAEVVVTGVTAGTEQKKLPFTVARVDESALPVPSANPLTELEGKVPGAAIVQASGRPGSVPSVMLRGPKSINGQGRGQGPLYIVDGIELNGPISDINPQDIESVEVVKGAAASSLYGARAGNGVISITTKSGRRGGEGVRYNLRSEYGLGNIERKFPLAQNHFLMMDETQHRFCVVVSGAPQCSQTVDFAEEANRVNELAAEVALSPVSFQNDAGIAATPSKTLLRGLFQVNQWPTVYDPVGMMITDGQHLNNTIDASGQLGGTAFFASGNSYIEQGGIKFLNGFRRNSVRLNVDQNVGQEWSFGVRTFYSRNSGDGANFENNNNRGFFGLTRTPVSVNTLATDKYGRLYIRSNPLNQGNQNENPMYWFQNYRQVDQDDRFLGNATSKYSPTNWLDFDASLSYDRQNATTWFFRDRGFRTTGNNPNNPLGMQENDASWSQSYNGALNAQARQAVGTLNVRYTARYLYEQQDNFTDFLFGTTLASAGLTTANNATSAFSIGSTNTSIRSIGMMGGVDADWKDRYIVGALFRRDGSSLFGSANRWANYGRGSLAWRVSEEPWWFAPKAVNDLKLRVSRGSAGGRPRFDAQYETFTIGTGGTLQPNTLGNKNLRPETVIETEYGFDAELFSRVGLSVNYSDAVSKDQILLVKPPAISGFNNQWQNAGTLASKTWEASLNVPLVQKRNVNWSARVNYDRIRSTITKLNVPPFFDGSTQQGADQIWKFAEGERFGTMYGRKFITSCSELPSTFRSQCGTGQPFQKNNEGYIVWVGQGNTPRDGITKNLWGTVLPASASPWGTDVNWGMPLILRDSTGTGMKVALGNVMPDYRLGFSSTFNYRKLFLYAQVDGSYGQVVWNEGRHWSLGDFMDHEVDQVGKSVADAKPIGYYWRSPKPDDSRGLGGLYDGLGPNSTTTEDASYTKLREVNVSYNVGPVRGVGDWTVSVVGRNLKTWTKYTGFDPEVGLTGNSNITGSSALAAVDAFNFPNLRTFSFSLSTRF